MKRTHSAEDLESIKLRWRPRHLISHADSKPAVIGKVESSRSETKSAQPLVLLPAKLKVEAAGKNQDVDETAKLHAKIAALECVVKDLSAEKDQTCRLQGEVAMLKWEVSDLTKEVERRDRMLDDAYATIDVCEEEIAAQKNTVQEFAWEHQGYGEEEYNLRDDENYY